MMKKALSVALCLLMAGTVLTACSNPDEFSDSEKPFAEIHTLRQNR